MGGGNKGGGNVGKAGREGCYSPPIDLYRRQVRDNSYVTIHIHIILHTYYVKCQYENIFWIDEAYIVQIALG